MAIFRPTMRRRRVFLAGAAVVCSITLVYLVFRNMIYGIYNCTDVKSPELSGSRFITIHGIGRWGMGNELFALVSLLGIAYHNKLHWELCFPSTADIRYIYNLTSLPCCDVADFKAPSWIYEQGSAVFSKNMLDLPKGEKSIAVGRFLQSWKYLGKHQNTIRNSLHAYPNLEARASYRLNKYVSNHFGCTDCVEDTCLIGLHIRRGNMEHDNYLNFKGYVTATAKYVDRAMTVFRDKIKSGLSCGTKKQTSDSKTNQRYAFLLSSDESRWFKNNVNQSIRDVIDISSTDHVSDFLLLSKCHHSIITVGTYGYMAAWVAGGQTVYYNQWPRPGSQLDRETRKTDYFPPQWIGME